MRPIEVGDKMIFRANSECVCLECGASAHTEYGEPIYQPVTVLSLTYRMVGFNPNCNHLMPPGHGIVVQHDWVNRGGLVSGWELYPR